MNTWKGLDIPAVKHGRNKGVLRALRERKRAEAEERQQRAEEKRQQTWSSL